MTSYTVNENEFGWWIVGSLPFDDITYFLGKWKKRKSASIDLVIAEKLACSFAIPKKSMQDKWRQSLGIIDTKPISQILDDTQNKAALLTTQESD